MIDFDKESTKGNKWIITLCRVLLFCLSCATMLALSSGLTKNWLTVWAQFLSIVLAAIGAFLTTIIFVKWEGLKLKDVGVMPERSTIPRLLIGFTIGLILALLQPLIVLMSGHLKLVYTPQINITTIVINLLLYIAVACREEIAFRGYPLRSLNYIIGPWASQSIIALIFTIEHVVGGMAWPQAIFGAGMGALLFGLATLRTKGIALSVGLHSAWNFGQWSLGFKNGNGLFKAIIEKGYEARIEEVGWISYLLIIGLAIACFYYWKKKSFSLYEANLKH
jgi:membrane protease YdiL (CAAX protease family)